MSGRLVCVGCLCLSSQAAEESRSHGAALPTHHSSASLAPKPGHVAAVRSGPHVVVTPGARAAWRPLSPHFAIGLPDDIGVGPLRASCDFPRQTPPFQSSRSADRSSTLALPLWVVSPLTPYPLRSDRPDPFQEGRTALHLAAEGGFQQVVHDLVRRGASKTARDKVRRVGDWKGRTVTRRP
jgi:hypothetical protein